MLDIFDALFEVAVYYGLFFGEDDDSEEDDDDDENT